MSHKLAIIGPMSPPIGGISVHLDRLLPHLDRANVDYYVYNTAGPTEVPGRVRSVAAHRKWWFLRYVLFGREKVIYMPTNNLLAWILSWFLSKIRGKKVVINLQGETLRWTWESKGTLGRKMIAAGFGATTKVIACNTHIYEFLKNIGDFTKKTIVAPGYIPPIHRAEDDAAVPQEVKDFCATHSPVILATGASVLRENGTDLYGVDMTIELVDRLRKIYPNIGVMWFMLNVLHSVPEHEKKMREEVERRQLGDHFKFCSPVQTFYPVYKYADIFVRPTLSDGDALSVREALSAGVPTVASDAAPRPDLVNLFRKRDFDDYEKAVRKTLETLELQRKLLEGRQDDSSVNDQVALLQEVIARAA